MIPRRLESQILTDLSHFPAVSLVGSRQTGKTTLAKHLAIRFSEAIYVDLERPSDLAKLADPELFLTAHEGHLVILDEIQRRPDLFPALRSLIDHAPRPGRFLLLGSASPALLHQSSESLAGRIVYRELAPLVLAEVEASGISRDSLWQRGGYPTSLLAPEDGASFAWREAFITTFLERDLPQLGIRVPAPRLRRFWLMLAHLHGQLWNASRLAASLGLSAPTVNHYLDLLEETYLVRRLLPVRSNAGKRLVKSPKVYFRDSGLLHALLGVQDRDQLLGHPILGASWEGWVVEQILEGAPRRWDAAFYRTAAGAEIDLVLLPRGRPPIPIEIKVSTTPALSRGFHQGFRDLGAKSGFVIHAGEASFPLAPGVIALPTNQLAQVFE